MRFELGEVKDSGFDNNEYQIIVLVVLVDLVDLVVLTDPFATAVHPPSGILLHARLICVHLPICLAAGVELSVASQAV